MEWVISHWQYILLGFFILEKIVKVSPAKWDDILVDSIREGYKKWREVKK